LLLTEGNIGTKGFLNFRTVSVRYCAALLLGIVKELTSLDYNLATEKESTGVISLFVPRYF